MEGDRGREREREIVQGKEQDLKQTRSKELELECKLTDKNMQAMLQDGAVDSDLGIALPGSSKDKVVKEESTHEDVPILKEKLAEIKSSYFFNASAKCNSEAKCLSKNSEAKCLSNMNRNIYF